MNIKLFFLLLIFLLKSTICLSYCTPTYTSAYATCFTYEMGIGYFVVAGESSTEISDYSSCSGSGYENNTSMSVEMLPGDSYYVNIATVSSTYNVSCQVWIDYNNNGVFESSESAGGLNSYTSGSFYISVPSSATTGSHRMRLITSYYATGYSYPSMDPCASGYSYGDARDYTVNILSTGSSASPYCTPVYSYGYYACYSYDMGICSFLINGTSSTSIADYSSCSGTGYENKTSLSVSLYQGFDYLATISTCGTYSMSCCVWIDFNNDNSFESTEYVGELSSYTSSSFYINIPYSASTGTHRMRVVTVYGSTASTSNPCASGYSYGDARDYTVNILSSGCTGTPGAGSVSSTTSSACSPYYTTISVSGESSGTGITYQWQSSVDASTWSNISGATNTYIYTYVSVTTFYRIQVTCASSSITSHSSYITASIISSTSSGTISGPTSVCAGSLISLTESVSGGTWSSTNTAVATVDASGNVYGVSVGSVNILYTVTGYCGTSETSYSMSINRTPTVEAISGPSTVCVGATINLTDAVSGGTWSSGSTSNATVSSVGIVTGVSGGTLYIDYLVSNVCGTAIASYSITVDPLPATGSISGSSSVCVGRAINLSETVTGGIWSSGSTGIATVSATGIVNGVSSGYVIISYSITNSCGTAIATYFLTVNGTPSAGIITGSSAICNGSTAVLTDGVSGGTWSSGSTAIATVNSFGDVYGISAGTVQISYTVSNACNTSTTLHSLEVVPYPVLGTITGFSVVCVGDTIYLGDGISGGNWSTNAPYTASISNLGVVTGINSGTATITYAVANSCGSVFTTTTLSVNPDPNPIITFSGSGPCLFVNSYSNYQWYHDGVPISGGNINIIFVDSPGAYTVKSN